MSVNTSDLIHDWNVTGEIAARLDITREATKSRLHRARLLVREYLMPVTA